ncbi:Nudix hydrolase domain-containing protein [Fusarium keratoplasticum]|uniref:Nudix hydrolase domain-containing protein n=1 Tax=Fusarium keratoplasticum TaxID=1328300 RepID=A0ACC0QTD7_9HYPO|nr:Nudix hydrolase domain-containing protein [Fusarium keratoplasticum]KAI8666565.1 Nudix hydrolase domain-containing protein [Fusarium keratoplasticum]
MNAAPPTTYKASPSLQAFASFTPAAFLAANPSIHHLMTGALVTNAQGQVLLLRRAPHDSWPLKWEIPGGCVDDEDVNIVAAAVRELWEETGLRAKIVKAPVRLVPADQAGELPVDVLETKLEMIGDFLIFRVKEVVWGKLAVWIDVESYDAVKICDDEHVEFAWVTEQEARERKFSDGRELDFTSEGVRRNVLEGFRLWREERDTE